MKELTPGEILNEDYLKPFGLSQNALGRALGVSPRAINEIIHGKRGITAAMSIRLGKFFKQSSRFWLNIQTECDVRKALKQKKALTAKIIPYEAVAEDANEYKA
ncbi:MAG: HigA family addiction module antitoxin [Verrucomicrobia bacterium]|nr:HigA family addiction module antitoxin [Verrucomicrobiota bacterium]